MTLYLKYRSQTLEELDSENVRESLKKIVTSGAIPHAFLFSGPKGTGKTSAARILAKIVNCEQLATSNKRKAKSFEPCNKCYQCISITKGENLDVIELDAASHRGIDDIRTLRDAVKLASAQAAMKVYIIDEAHMLTTEASNALLKTLEEPPAHVMFILATTNPEKLVETIRSRTTNILFKKANTPQLVRSLERIVKGEKLKAEEGVLEIIAKASDGSFRDAAKILEQLVTEEKKLDKETVGEILFQRKAFSADKFLAILAKRGTKEALEEIKKTLDSGVTVRNLVDAVIERLRNALLAKVGIEGEDFIDFDKSELILLIKLFSRTVGEIPDAVLEQIPVEIAVVEWCSGGEPSDGKKESLRTLKDTEDTEGTRDIRKSRTENSVSSVMSESSEIAAAVSIQKGNGVSDDVWLKILAAIRPKNTSTEALLRATRPVDYDGKTLTLGVYYRFHKERLEGHPHRMLLEDTIAAVFGNPVKVICTLTNPPDKPNPKEREAGTTTPGAALTEPNLVLTEGEDEDIIKVAKEIFGS